MLLPAAFIAVNNPDEEIPTFDVRCDPLSTYEYGCFLEESAVVLRPTILNFIDADAWNNTTQFTITRRFIMVVIPFGIFQRFPALQIFSINTGLTSINKENFKDANNLTELELYNNKLTILPSNVFEYAKHLKQIQLGYNELRTIEDFAFSGLNELESLYLDHNYLIRISRNTFAGAESVKAIHLAYNHIETIEDGALNLPLLKEIWLGDNRMRMLSDHIFTGAPSLQSLSLVINDLSRIGQSVYNLTNLEEIYLVRNHIEDIDLPAFAKLPKLLKLSLDNSGFKLSSIDQVQWPNVNPSVVHLDISNNNLTESDVLFRLKHFTLLEELDLGYNNFIVIDGLDVIKNIFPKLVNVNLSGNGITCDKVREIGESLKSQNITLDCYYL